MQRGNIFWRVEINLSLYFSLSCVFFLSFVNGDAIWFVYSVLEVVLFFAQPPPSTPSSNFVCLCPAEFCYSNLFSLIFSSRTHPSPFFCPPPSILLQTEAHTCLSVYVDTETERGWIVKWIGRGWNVSSNFIFQKKNINTCLTAVISIPYSVSLSHFKGVSNFTFYSGKIKSAVAVVSYYFYSFSNNIFSGIFLEGESWWITVEEATTVK